MKEHIQAEMNNELVKIVKAYHGFDSLWETISRCTHRYIEMDREWRKIHPTDSKDQSDE